MRQAATEIEQQFVEQAKQPYALQATWRFVIASVAQKLLLNYEYQQLCATTLELSGDISCDMADLARFEPGWLQLDKFASSEIRISIGQYPQHEVVIPTTREPPPHQRR